MSRNTRREFLKTAGAGIGVTALAGCSGGNNANSSNGQSSTKSSSGTTTSQSSTGGNSKYKPHIEVVTPLTGPLAVAGPKIKAAAKLAVADANQKYSDKPPVTYDVKDSKANVQTARNLANQAFDAGSVAVTGTVSSDVALALRALVQQKKVPFLPSNAVNPEVTKAGTKYVYRTTVENNQNAIGSAQYFKNAGIQKAALIGADFSYPRSFAKAIKQYAGKYGVQLTQEQYVPLGTKNFNPTIQNIDFSSIDALYTIYPGKNATVLIKQLRQNGAFDKIKQTFGGNTYGSPPLAKALGSDRVDVGWEGRNRANKVVSALGQEIQSQLNATPNIYHFVGYDSVRYAAEAIHAADTLTPEGVNKALQNNPMNYHSRVDDSLVKPGSGGYNKNATLTCGLWEKSGSNVDAKMVYTTKPLNYR